MLIFLVIQGALYFYARSVALQAAREGVSQLRLVQQPAAGAGCDPSAQTQIEASTESYAGTVGSGALSAAKAKGTCVFRRQGNSTVTVQVTGHAISLLGFTLAVDQKATGRVEQFQNEAPN